MAEHVLLCLLCLHRSDRMGEAHVDTAVSIDTVVSLEVRVAAGKNYNFT